MEINGRSQTVEVEQRRYAPPSSYGETPSRNVISFGFSCYSRVLFSLCSVVSVAPVGVLVVFSLLVVRDAAP